MPPISKPSTFDGSRSSQKIAILAALYGVAFLTTLWAAYNNRLPLIWLSQFPNYDKVGHVVLYCIPTYLGHRLCKQKHLKRHFNQTTLSLPVFPALFVLFTITEELIQGLSPYRTLDPGDMICSLAGIGLGYWLVQRSLKLSPRR